MILLIVPRMMDEEGAVLLRKLSLAVDRQSVLGKRVQNVVLVFLFIAHLQWPNTKVLKVAGN